MASIKKKNFYAYFLSEKEHWGIVTSWPECENLIKGFSHQIKKHSSFKEALIWLESLVKEENTHTKHSGENALFSEECIYFDSGTGRNLGVEIFLADKNKNPLLSQIIKESYLTKFKTYRIPLAKEASNNYGELLACFFALKLALKTNQKNIAGDSRLVIDYWSKGLGNKKSLHPHTVQLIEIVSSLRDQFEKKGGNINYISGDKNPADLGFHK